MALRQDQRQLLFCYWGAVVWLFFVQVLWQPKFAKDFGMIINSALEDVHAILHADESLRSDFGPGSQV